MFDRGHIEVRSALALARVTTGLFDHGRFYIKADGRSPGPDGFLHFQQKSARATADVEDRFAGLQFCQRNCLLMDRPVFPRVTKLTTKS